MNQISTEWDDKPCDIKTNMAYLLDRWENEVHETQERCMFDVMREQGYRESQIVAWEEYFRSQGLDPAKQMIPVVVRTYDKRTGKPFKPMTS